MGRLRENAARAGRFVETLLRAERGPALCVDPLGAPIGQAVIALGGTIRYFVDHVFNYPTLAECYKVAALAGINKL